MNGALPAIRRWFRDPMRQRLGMSALVLGIVGLIALLSRPVIRDDTLYDRLNANALALLGSGRFEAALSLAERSYQESRQVLGARHRSTINALGVRGGVLQEQGRLAEAYSAYEEAFILAEQALPGAHPDAITARTNLASILHLLGRPAEALPLFRRALSLLGDAPDENAVIALNNVAMTLRALGRFEEALDVQTRALARFGSLRGQRDPQVLAMLHNNVAYTHDILGQPDRALPLYESAFTALNGALGERHPRSLVAANNLAFTLQTLGRSADALPRLEKVLALRTEVLGEGHPDSLLSLRDTAVALDSLSRRDDAFSHWQRYVDGVEAYRTRAAADSEASRRGVFSQYVDGYLDYARALHRAGRDADAFDLLERTKARTLLEEMAGTAAARAGVLPEDVARALKDLAHEVAELDRRLLQGTDDAERHDLMRERAARTRDLATLRASLAESFPRYRQLTEVAPAGVRDARAVLERDAIFLSYAVAADESVVVATLDAEGRVRWVPLPRMSGLGDAVEALHAWLSDPTPGATSVFRWTVEGVPRWLLGGDEDTVCRRYRESRLALASTAQRELRAEESSEAQPIARQSGPLRGLPRPGRLEANRLPPPACLPPGTERYTSSTDPRNVAARDELVRQLSDALITPLIAVLKGKRAILVSPGGPLGLLPFDVLRVEGRSLIERFDVSQVQSLSVLKLVRAREAENRRRHAGRRALFAIGDPDYQQGAAVPAPGTDAPKLWPNLPFTGGEIESATRLYATAGAASLTGIHATESALRDLSRRGELARYRYLLFSAHGYFDPALPDHAALVLKPEGPEAERDGYVTTAEWTTLDLASDLAILSACDTARGAAQAGEGLMGLAYGLYVAGNAQTVVTLWQVSDERTRVFMTAFLARLKSGLRASRALSETKREFLASSGSAHPFYWAPFLLYGY
jgi:CHAT domain-containing protein/tetratricopeptide (TPR) repeat protein